MDIFIESSLYLYKNSYHSTAHKRSKVDRESSSVLHITFHGFFYCFRQCTCQHVAPGTKTKNMLILYNNSQDILSYHVKEQQILFHKFHLFTETNLHTCINILSTYLVYCEFFCVINMLTFLGM